MTQLNLGDVSIDVMFKDIKNLHLSVNPPSGNVRISAPARMTIDSVRLFAISKLTWIKQQRNKQISQERETAREYIDRESHYVWGKRYLLKVIEQQAAAKITVQHRHLLLQVRPGADKLYKQALAEEWYRKRLKERAIPLIKKWEDIMGVKINQLFVQKMKTKWGGCNAKHCNIRLNTELAKKAPEYLEYIIVHEMAHLLEPTHNSRFISLLDHFMPNWQMLRNELNSLPIPV